MPEPGYSSNYIPVAADPLDDEYDALFLEGNDVHRDDSVDCALYLGKLEIISEVCKFGDVSNFRYFDICNRDIKLST